MPETPAMTPEDDSLLQEKYAPIYERLGFTLPGESATDYAMDWRPDSAL